MNYIIRVVDTRDNSTVFQDVVDGSAMTVPDFRETIQERYDVARYGVTIEEEGPIEYGLEDVLDLIEKHNTETEAPVGEAGLVLRALAETLIDRGFDEQEVMTRLGKWIGSGHESDWWERWGGPAADNLAYALGYPEAFPPDEFDESGPPAGLA